MKWIDGRTVPTESFEEADAAYEAARSLLERYVTPGQAAAALRFWESKFFGFLRMADPDRIESITWGMDRLENERTSSQ